MSFCANCGTELKDEMKVCPGCNAPNPGYKEPQAEANSNMGTAFGTDNGGTSRNNGGYTFGGDNSNGGQSYGGSNPNNGQNFQNNAQQAFNNFNNTADTTGEYDPNDISANKVMAILAYFGILVLIPILAAPTSKFARFHSNQGVIVLIVALVGWILGFVPIIGWLASLIVTLFAVVIAIIGLINAAQGKAKEVPVVGSLRLLK
jgi:uncharacterized membrane protein